MKKLIPVALSCGLIAALWVTGSTNLQLGTFAGFLAWSTYFAVGGTTDTFFKGLISNISGIVWGFVVVSLTSLLTPYLGAMLAMALATAFGSIMVVLQSHINILSYIPGTFIGLSAFFATDSQFVTTLVAMVIGAFLGVLSEKLSTLLNFNKFLFPKEEKA